MLYIIWIGVRNFVPGLATMGWAGGLAWLVLCVAWNCGTINHCLHYYVLNDKKINYCIFSAYLKI